MSLAVSKEPLLFVLLWLWSCVPKERGTISWLQQSCIYIHSSEIHLWKEWRISYCCPVLQLAGAWSLGCFLKGHSLSQLLHAQKSQPKPLLDSCIIASALKADPACLQVDKPLLGAWQAEGWDLVEWWAEKPSWNLSWQEQRWFALVSRAGSGNTGGMWVRDSPCVPWSEMEILEFDIWQAKSMMGYGISFPKLLGKHKS